MHAERGSAGGVSAPSAPSALTVADVSARNGVSLAVRDDVPQTATLMSGDFLQLGLGSGIQVHGGTLVEEMAFDIQSSIDGGLSCIFFLEGRVQTSIGGRSFDFHAVPGRPIQGATLMNARPETFTRRSAAKQRVTHLVINVSEDWLGQHGLDLDEGGGGTRQLLSENLTDHRWVVPHDLHRLIRQIMGPSDGGSLRHLYAEAQAIQILADSISHATISSLARSGHGGRRQTAMLGRAKDFIHTQTDAELSVAAIAQEAGVSVSGLQTLFRQHEGCGVSEYVRRTRLDRAHHALLHDGISIDEATRLAGYAHAANFATAFRKRFHVSPRSVGRG